jgi:hypothetical protein
MKKLSILIAACFLFISTESVFAVELKEHIFKIGPEISYIKYKEPGFMEEKGITYGLSASYTYHSKQSILMLGWEGIFNYGKLDYDGETFEGTSVDIDNIPNYLYEMRALIGIDLPVKASYVTVFTGIGYRYLDDDISKESANGYDRESNYLYSPVGMKLTTPLANNWTFGATAEFDIFWDGTQKSHLSNVDSDFNDLKNDQDNGYGLRGSVSFQKKLKNLWIEIQPFIRYWNIKQSDPEVLKFNGIPIGNAVEPKNHSTQVGVMLLIGAF